MQIHGTSVLTSKEPGRSQGTTVFDLPYDELVVALYASGLPTAAMRGTPRLELIERAAEGLARIGAELAWWTAYRSRRIGGQIDRATPAMRAEYRRMWPDRRREDAAISAAYDAVFAPGAPRWPGHDGRTVKVEIAAGPGMAFIYTEQARDLEHAARYPHRADEDPQLRMLLLARTAALASQAGEAA